jgi:8-oxo-dGTP diphosphatase
MRRVCGSQPVRQRFSLSTSVFVMVHRHEKILLLRRANTGWKDGMLSLPAGSHDGGEPLVVAAARELREEAGVVAAPAALRLVHLMHCRSGDSGGEWLGAFFRAEAWQGEPRLMERDKHDHLDWFASSCLPENVIPYTAQGIRHALQGVPYSEFGWDDAG